MASELAPPPPTQAPAPSLGSDVMDAQEHATFQAPALNGYVARCKSSSLHLPFYHSIHTHIHMRRIIAHANSSNSDDNQIDEPTALPIDSAIDAPSDDPTTTLMEPAMAAKQIVSPLPDSLPAGPAPAPVENVTSGIQPVADFIPKDSSHLSHPTPPPDEPLTTGIADVDINNDVAMSNPEPEVLPPVEPAHEEVIAAPEQSLVRPREDDADDEPAAKRSKVDEQEVSTLTEPSTMTVQNSLMDDGPSESASASRMEMVDEPAMDVTDAPLETPVPAVEPELPANDPMDIVEETPMQAPEPVQPAVEDVVEQSTQASSAEVNVEATQPEAESADAPGESIASESAVVAETQVEAGPSQPASVPAVESQATVADSQPVTASSSSDAPSKPVYSTEPMTSVQKSSLIEKTKNLKKTKNSMAFLRPVDPVALNIPTYVDIIKNPMDLSTMEAKLKEGKYASINDYASDFDLIINNVRRFNGEGHAITQAGYSLQAYFRKMMEQVPTADQKAPVKQEKRRSPSVTREKPPRRESRIPPAPAAQPAPPAQATETYALQPDGTPQIRRQSSNRPARAIKPPQNREIPYAKPKRKAHQLELKFCEHVLDEIRSAKYGAQNHVFQAPVDPVALNIPHYRQVIKQPMDLGTMSNKLRLGEYGTANEFKKDFDLIVKNCLLFNPVGNPVRDLGIGLQRHFEALWAEKEKWERKNQPPSNRASSASADDESAEDDDDDDDEVDDKTATIIALQKQLADMQNALSGISGKPPKKKTKTAKSTVKKESSISLPKSKASSSKAAPKKKVRSISYDEKQEISESVPRMNESQVSNLTTIITQHSEKHRNMGDDMELEIDDLPTNVQAMLLDYVRKIFGNPKKERSALKREISPDDAAALDDDDFEPEHRRGSTSAGTKRKKHKPMGKREQLDQISKIRGQLAQFGGAATSESASPTGSGSFAPAGGRGGDDTSGDDESEESEEE